MAYYDVAQVCLNGHMINDHARSRPLHNQEYCTRCGAKTLTACPSCQKPIRGDLNVEGVVDLTGRQIPVPPFCQYCAKALPWTESRLEAASALADQLQLDIPERALVEKSIEEMVKDTPRAPAEAIRFKTIVQRAQPWGFAAFKEILNAVVSESVKRMLWP